MVEVVATGRQNVVVLEVEVDEVNCEQYSLNCRLKNYLLRYSIILDQPMANFINNPIRNK